MGVVRILRQHGLTPRAARATEAIAAHLLARTRQADAEFAALLDANLGTAVGRVLGGSQASVDIGPHLAAMQAGRRYVSIHTHPRSTSFSPADVDVFLAHAALRIMVVVGADGTWYVLSRMRRGRPPSRRAVLDAFRDEVLALRSKYLDVVRTRKMSQKAAWREHGHEAWTNVVGQFGLRYDRIEP